MQKEVIDYLIKVKEPKGRAEIAQALGQRETKVSDCLKKLLKFNEVAVVEIDRFAAKIRFGAKRRVRLFYVPEE